MAKSNKKKTSSTNASGDIAGTPVPVTDVARHECLPPWFIGGNSLIDQLKEIEALQLEAAKRTRELIKGLKKADS